MNTRRLLRAVAPLLFALGVALDATALPVATVEVAGSRVRIGDLGLVATRGISDIDLGPTPLPGGSRLVTRDQIVSAIRARGAVPPPRIPDGVRVVRKMQHLSIVALERVALEAARRAPIPRGVSVVGARPGQDAEVPAGWDGTRLELPRPARRGGSQILTGTLTFLVGEDATARLSVAVEVTTDLEKAIPDIARGAAVTLVLARGAIEISAPATASADGDVGEVISVSIRPSGRSMKARIVDRERVVAVELR